MDFYRDGGQTRVTAVTDVTLPNIPTKTWIMVNELVQLFLDLKGI